MAKRRLPIVLREPEMAALVAAVPTARDRLIVDLGRYAGLRVSEIVRLRVEHLDLDAGLIEVHAGKGDKDRNLPLHRSLVEPLRACIGDRATGWLFPSPRGAGHLTSRSVQRMIAASAARAGIARRVTPHKLRHTFATTALRRGANLRQVQELLGHASVATTEIYTHLDVDDLREAVSRL